MDLGSWRSVVGIDVCVAKRGAGIRKKPEIANLVRCAAKNTRDSRIFACKVILTALYLHI